MKQAAVTHTQVDCWRVAQARSSTQSVASQAGLMSTKRSVTFASFSRINVRVASELLVGNEVFWFVLSVGQKKQFYMYIIH